MIPTTPTPAVDFAAIRSRCPRAFAALTSFVRHRADLPPITPTVVYTWLSKHPRDLFDFFDDAGIHIAVMTKTQATDVKFVEPTKYPTRAAAEAAAFTAAFERLEGVLNQGKELEK